jgi:hypothetical protein
LTYTDADGNELLLRGTLSPATRREYARIQSGPGVSPDDAWQRAVEFLYERLAVGWTIHEVPLEGGRQLLARFRVASPAERAFVRDSLRRHCAEHFPDLEAP